MNENRTAKEWDRSYGEGEPMGFALTLGSLFDGSGGFPLAGIMCGIEPKWAAEVEPYPIAVTRSRFPGMRHLGDISKVDGATIEPVDIITFGSPCQDLSVAGKRAGLKHETNGDEETTRSGLFMEAVRIIKEMREATNGVYPRFALWENVPGAFSSNKGEDFRIVLEELIKIVEPTAIMPAVPKNGWPYADSYCGDGWSISYRVFDAQYWGVPQRRRRIYLVADFGGQCAGKVLFERNGLRGYFAEGRTPWQGIAGNAENGAGADDREGGYVGFDSYNLCLTGGVGRTVTTPSGGLNEHIPCVIYHDNKPCEGNGVIAVDQGGGKSGANYHHNLSPTLTCTHGGEPAVAYKTWDARGNGDICPTITGDHNNRITDYTSVVCEPIPIHDQATRFSGKRGDNCDGKGNGLGIGNLGDPMNTMTAGDRHAVCYTITYQKCTGPLMANSHPGRYCGQDAYTDMLVVGEENPIVLDRAFYNQGVNAQYDPQYYDDGTVPTLVAKGPSAVCVRYIVRRLTPTECARLQGFVDCWGHPDKKDEFTEEEYRFWLDVRNTHAAINGKATKDYTKDQMVKWYNKLHTDSSEYKMWGNGIALPCALYVMQGIVDALTEKSDTERGDGGFGSTGKF